MKEILDIIEAFERAQQQARQTALATVVYVDGSSYRRPGARMLITEDGELTGAISGGCLEGDALYKALFAMHQQKNMLVTYDTSDDDDAKLGMGLGCNGIIHVFIEPVNPNNPTNPIQLLKNLTSSRKNAVLVTLFSLKNKSMVQPGTCMLYTEGKILSDNSCDSYLKNILEDEAKKALSSQQSFVKNYFLESQNVTAYIEFIKPVVSMVICGAGNDVVPLAKMAAILGWQALIINDGRDKNTKQSRFETKCHVLITDPEEVLSQFEIDDQTVFVLMTHNYNYDLAVLRQLIQKEVTYIGLLGPKKKRERMLEELKEEGVSLSEQQLSCIFSPVGLDIGAESPEEIALSILSEVKAVLAKRQTTTFLKNNPETIHLRTVIKTAEIKILSNL
ncbi:MAG: XdhC/CoxI family protein [Ginsengibacter sp.]